MFIDCTPDTKSVYAFRSDIIQIPVKLTEVEIIQMNIGNVNVIVSNNMHFYFCSYLSCSKYKIL